MDVTTAENGRPVSQDSSSPPISRATIPTESSTTEPDRCYDDATPEPNKKKRDVSPSHIPLPPTPTKFSSQVDASNNIGGNIASKRKESSGSSLAVLPGAPPKFVHDGNISKSEEDEAKRSIKPTTSSLDILSLKNPPPRVHNGSPKSDIDVAVVDNSQISSQLQNQRERYAEARHMRRALREQRERLWNKVSSFMSHVTIGIASNQLPLSSKLQQAFEEISTLNSRYGALEDDYDRLEVTLDDDTTSWGEQSRDRYATIQSEGIISGFASLFRRSDVVGDLIGTRSSASSAPDSITGYYLQEVAQLKRVQEYRIALADSQLLADTKQEVHAIHEKLANMVSCKPISASDVEPYSRNLATEYAVKERMLSHHHAMITRRAQELGQKLRSSGLNPDDDVEIETIRQEIGAAGIDPSNYEHQLDIILEPTQRSWLMRRNPLLVDLEWQMNNEPFDQSKDFISDSEGVLGKRSSNDYASIHHDHYSLPQVVSAWMLHSLRHSAMQVALYRLELGYWSLALDDRIAREVVATWWFDDTTTGFFEHDESLSLGPSYTVSDASAAIDTSSDEPALEDENLKSVVDTPLDLEATTTDPPELFDLLLARHQPNTSDSLSLEDRPRSSADNRSVETVQIDEHLRPSMSTKDEEMLLASLGFDPHEIAILPAEAFLEGTDDSDYVTISESLKDLE